MWLDRPHKFFKELIHVVIGFCATCEDVENLIGSKWDGREMMVNNINDPTVKYAYMVIGYRINYSSRMNNIPIATIHTAHRMIKEDIDYDLSEALRSQLVLNLESVKKDKRLRFKFGQLIIGLFFYFQNYFPNIDDIQWIDGTPALVQMKIIIRMLGNDFGKGCMGIFQIFLKENACKGKDTGMKT